MHLALLKTLDFSWLRAKFLTGQKGDLTDALTLLRISCGATNNPVRAAIECNDDGASVNAALCQVAHDECQLARGRSGGAAVTDEAAPSYNLARLCQVSRPGYCTAVRVKKNLHVERIAAVSAQRHARNVDITASCKIKWEPRRRPDDEMKIARKPYGVDHE